MTTWISNSAKQLPEFLADGADAAETIIFDGLAATQEKFNGR